MQVCVFFLSFLSHEVVSAQSSRRVFCLVFDFLSQRRVCPRPSDSLFEGLFELVVVVSCLADSRVNNTWIYGVEESPN